MKKIPYAFAVALITSAPIALATVDAVIPYTIAYEQVQTGDICLGRMPMQAVLGIPVASAAKATFSPAYMFVESMGEPTSSSENINLLGTNPGIAATFLNDEWDEAKKTIYAKIEIDVGGISKADRSVAGRQKTINTAKLAILALANNMKLSLFKPDYVYYKLDVVVKNLPSQDGLSGTKVYETTKYPYTESSSLLRQYRKDVLNRENGCPESDTWF